MGIVRGLKNITAYNEAEEAKFAERSNKAKWFGLKDKQAAKVIFLQEMDEDSEGFSKKNDLGFIAVEHSNPDNYQRKALCTLDEEGACWACEKNQSSWQTVKDYKGGWKQKSRLYINVLVDAGTEDPYVAVLSQGTSAKAVTPALIEQAGLLGTITDKWFQIRRNGASFSDTSYTLTALKEHDKNVEDYELFDLTKVVRSVPYAQQEAHYLGGKQDTGSDSAKESVGSSTGDSDPEAW
jgi:hypothetical protein